MDLFSNRSPELESTNIVYRNWYMHTLSLHKLVSSSPWPLPRVGSMLAVCSSACVAATGFSKRNYLQPQAGNTPGAPVLRHWTIFKFWAVTVSISCPWAPSIFYGSFHVRPGSIRGLEMHFSSYAVIPGCGNDKHQQGTTLNGLNEG